MRRFAPQLFAQLVCIVLVLCYVLLAPAKCSGQAREPVPSKEIIVNRGWLRGSLHEEFNREIARQKQAAQLSLKNDFRKLQIVNNQLMIRMFVPSATPTQKITNQEIRASLGEIKKVAERLKSNLPIPKFEVIEKPDQVALEAGLQLLDDAVMSFAHNPMFQQPRVYDAELAARASKDLSEVLRLTAALRKLAKEE